jgi:hypothetical protein
MIYIATYNLHLCSKKTTNEQSKILNKMMQFPQKIIFNNNFNTFETFSEIGLIFSEIGLFFAFIKSSA